MAPRSFLSVGLAVLFTALFAVPAHAQLRATAVRESPTARCAARPRRPRATAVFLVAWGIEGGVQLRAVDAAGAPTGPVQTVVLGTKYVSASELVLLPDALVINEYDSSSGYRKTTVRRLDATGAVVGNPMTVFGTGIRGIDAVRQARRRAAARGGRQQHAAHADRAAGRA